MTRVLICSEWSQLNTGYGVMTAEIAGRLQSLGFEVAELAMYAVAGDPRLQQGRWPVYPVVPKKEDKDARTRYDSDPHNQFGRLAFNPVAKEFRPDIVLAFQDAWYQQHIVTSPYRPFFRYLYIPPVDAEQQKDEWLDMMSMADAVGTYTDWGTETLTRECGGSLKLVGAISPGVDASVYRPIPNKADLRSAFGLPEDALVCGFVSRNQVRKRFPELAKAFRHFLDTAPSGVADRAHLYWHTSWPDLGWDLPSLVRDSGVGSRLWLTYVCKACHHVFASRWMGAGGSCPKCHQFAAVLPNTSVGVPREALPLVYNLMDVYVQYANSEGLGLGAIEAAACGVPVMAVDYSAMADVVKKVEGWPISLHTVVQELETGCLRAIPDKASFCEQLQVVLSLPEPVRRARGAAARDGVIRHYNWDQSVLKMANVFAGMEPALSWDSEYRPHYPARTVPNGLSNADFVQWGFTAVAGRPDLRNSSAALRMVRELDWGVTLLGNNPYFSDECFLGRSKAVTEVTRESLMKTFLNMAEERNNWEKYRC